MERLNGYMLLIVARKITKATVWHYSTGNDMGVCGADSGAESIGYTDTETAATLKGCCLACSRYVGRHGEYQGWDDVNKRRFLSITWPMPEPVSEAFCAMHREFISQCADQHNDTDAGFQETDSERTAGVQRIMDKVNAKKGFPVATPTDTDTHFMGSGFDMWVWWVDMNYKSLGSGNEVESWTFSGVAGYPEDFDKHVTIDHAAVIKAIRKIARVAVDENYGNSLYASRSVIRECRTWVFKGPDECDFDAGMADEVMQVAAFGVVTYC